VPFPASPLLGAFGNYRLLRKIARGGMAEVFLALLTSKAKFEKMVVLKRVLPELAENDEFVGSFLDEARLAARLDHPNIARVYDLGEVDGQFYLAMEYLAGEDLASVIQQCRRAGTLPPFDVVAEIGREIAEGLAFAHAAIDVQGKPLGVVHRDVSPSNVVATYQGEVKLIDFGIARAESNLIRTGGGKPKGKVQYMAPEQAAGGKVDARSDIFSAGVVLHELVTTQRLFRRGSDKETHEAVLAADCKPPSALRAGTPAELDRICGKALARDPEARYPTAAEMATDLAKLCGELSRERAEPRIAAFLTSLFPPERSAKKIRLAQGMPMKEHEADVTPVLSFDGFTPIRTNPNPKPPAKVPIVAYAPQPKLVVVPAAPAVEPPKVEPILPPAPTVARRSPVRLVLVAIAAALLLLGGFAAGVAWSSRHAPTSESR
jgi:serine/threonine protein kinase